MPSQTYGESMLNHVDFMNLYIKNLDTHVTNDDLAQLFRKYGRIISARVMTNQTGQSKGYGFVSFVKPEEAAAALQEMNGYILANRPLIVSYHEPKKKLNNNSSNSTTANVTATVNSNSNSNNHNYNYNYNNNYNHTMNGNSHPITTTTTSAAATTATSVANNYNNNNNNNNQYQYQYQQQQHYHNTTTNTTNSLSSNRPIIYDKPNTNDIVGLGIVDQLGMRDLSIGQRSPPKKGTAPYYPSPVYAASSIVRRNSNESVMTEATAKVQRIKIDSAVRRCGHYGRMTEEIVDMLMTLKRKERSLCLFNSEYLKEKVQLAVDALTTCDDSDDDSYVDMDYKRESKVIVPTSTPTTTTTSPSSILSVSKGVKVENLISSFEGKPLHEQKQLLGDQLFPLVKATGTRQAPKVTIYLLDTVDLYELASIMYNGPVLKRRVDDAFTHLQQQQQV